MHTLKAALGALVVAITLPLMAAPAQAEEVTPKLLLIGDSIAVRYAAEPTTWMNVVAADRGYELRRYAASGTGFIKGGGDKCADTYPKRLANIAKDRPRVIVVEDVIGDATTCKNNWFSTASRAQVKSLTDSFMRDLAVAASKAGVKRERVYVFAPSTQKIKNYDWSRDYAKAAAARHKITYVTTYLAKNQTVDGIHPNPKGQVVLAAALNAALAKGGS